MRVLRVWRELWYDGTETGRCSIKHVDSLLCDTRTTRPRLIIELDDSSHNRPKRHARDAFLDRVCGDAGLPILHQPVQIAYNARDIWQMVRDQLTKPNNTTGRSNSIAYRPQ